MGVLLIIKKLWPARYLMTTEKPVYEFRHWTPPYKLQFHGSLACTHCSIFATSQYFCHLQNPQRIHQCSVVVDMHWFWSAGSESSIGMQIRIQKRLKLPTKLEKVKKFHALKCWMFSFDGWRLVSPVAWTRPRNWKKPWIQIWIRIETNADP